MSDRKNTNEHEENAVASVQNDELAEIHPLVQHNLDTLSHAFNCSERLRSSSPSEEFVAKENNEVPTNKVERRDMSNTADRNRSVKKQTEKVSIYSCTNFAQITGAWTAFRSKRKENNFMKGCKWAPDGTCILSNSDDNVLHIFDLPPQLHCQESWQKNVMLPEMEPALQITECDMVYDYCWYPLMSSWNPLSCCIVSTSRECPVHLWDAFTGQLRCTYRSYNAVDEVEAAYSVCFNPSGEKLYCGFRNRISIFNTSIPGRICEDRNLKASKVPSERQGGIVSCISVNPMMPDIYAVGTYSRSIGLYGEPSGTMLCMFLGHSGGLTQLTFSPDGTKLLSGGRKDSEIICWDIRNPGHVLFTLERIVTTSQRIYFDVSADSSYIVSGNTDGTVTVWDMTNTVVQTSGEPILPPANKYVAHDDCVNGISIHQQYPILATSSGQRHIPKLELSSDSEEDSSESSQSTPKEEIGIKLWWVGRTTEITDKEANVPELAKS